MFRSRSNSFPIAEKKIRASGRSFEHFPVKTKLFPGFGKYFSGHGGIRIAFLLCSGQDQIVFRSRCNASAGLPGTVQ